MIQFGMRCHDICPKMEMTKVFDEVQKLGVHYIQLAMSKSISDYDFTTGNYSAGFGHYIGEELNKRDIHVSVLGCYINPVNPDEDSRQAEIARYIEHLKYAKRIGADMVGSETGRYSVDMSVVPETNTEMCYRRYLDSMKRIVDAAEKLGVTVGVEGVYDHTISTPQLMKRFLDDIDSPAVEVILDGVNIIRPDMQTAEQQKQIIDEAFALYGDRISVLHLKDMVFEGQSQKFRHPGEGIFAYENLMPHLKKNKPMIVGLLENSSPDRYHEDVKYLQEKYALA